MAVAEDTEITLGTGKMLALFFGLVALCAVFFSLGFSLGRKSGTNAGLDSQAALVTPAGVRPTAIKSNDSKPPSDLTFYKAVGQKNPDTQLAAKAPEAPADTAPRTQHADDNAPPPDPITASVNAYYVQVAAVTKLEDAGALVEALKKKQYTAFSANLPGDKLFHVQVGPFSDIKDAELARAKLVNDGYNPILKK